MNISEIEINARKCNGKPIIAGTRIPVTVILEQFEAKVSIPEMLKKYPELIEDQIISALRYCRNVIEHSESEELAAG